MELLKQAGDVGSENAAEASQTKHHAYCGTPYLGVVRRRHEIVQNVLAAQDAESSGSHENNIQRMNVYKREDPNRDCSAKPPDHHRPTIISTAVRKKATDKRTHKRHALDQCSEAEAGCEGFAALHHCRRDPAGQTEN